MNRVARSGGRVSVMGLDDSGDPASGAASLRQWQGKDDELTKRVSEHVDVGLSRDVFCTVGLMP